MSKDPYSAVWVSHTSLSDYSICPRAYFLKNVYRNPRTGHKIKLMSPPLALGQVVHEVIESLSQMPVAERFRESLVSKFHFAWTRVAGKKGGFINPETELAYRKRGEQMMIRLMRSPGPLQNKAVKIKMDLPQFWLSEKDNIILCGKIDWLEYLPDTDSVHIIDFKTSKLEEEKDSLQLPIYYLLVRQCQSKRISKVSYWYLEQEKGLTEQQLPDLDTVTEKLHETAQRIKTARKLSVFPCSKKTGCYACKPFEKILRGEAEYVGLGSYKEDIYIVENSRFLHKKESVIL